MRAHAAAGDGRAALLQFERMDRVLRRELGEGPRRRWWPARRAAGGPACPRAGHARRGGSAQPGDPLLPDPGRRRAGLRRQRPGPPLVKAANWLTHLDHDWNSPVWRHWLVELSRHTGWSATTNGVAACRTGTWTGRSRLGRGPRDGRGRRGPRPVPPPGHLPGRGRGDHLRRAPPRAGQPSRHLRLVRPGTAATATARATTVPVPSCRSSWPASDGAPTTPPSARCSPPSSCPRRARSCGARSTSSNDSPPHRRTRPGPSVLTNHLDITEIAQQVRTPTLVLHARDDRRPPFEQGRLLASLIPSSRFVALDSSNHILLGDEPAWLVFTAEVEDLLATPDHAGAGVRAPPLPRHGPPDRFRA